MRQRCSMEEKRELNDEATRFLVHARIYAAAHKTSVKDISWYTDRESLRCEKGLSSHCLLWSVQKSENARSLFLFLSKKHNYTVMDRARRSRELTDDLWDPWVNNDGAKESRFPTRDTWSDASITGAARGWCSANIRAGWSIVSLKILQINIRKYSSLPFIHMCLVFSLIYFLLIIYK